MNSSNNTSISAGLAILAVIPILATVLGIAGRSSWALELFSHFHVHYLAVQCLLIPLCLVIGARKTALFAVLTTIPNLWIVGPQFLPDTAAYDSRQKPLKALLLNVNSSTGDPNLVLGQIQEYKPHLVLLLEITDSWVAALTPLHGDYPHRMIQPREDNFGIGLYSRLPLADAQISLWGPFELPYINAKPQTPWGPVHLIGIHPLPPTSSVYAADRNQMLEHLPQLLLPDTPGIVMGDLNATLWSPPLRDLRQRADLDAPGGLHVTWPAFARPLGIQIDHFLHSKQVVVTDFEVGGDVGSDHLPVLVSFVLAAD